MADSTVSRIWKAIRELNPARTEAEAGKTFSMAFVGATPEEIGVISDAVIGPAAAAPAALPTVKVYVQPISYAQVEDLQSADIIIAARGSEPVVEHPGRVCSFDVQNPAASIKAIAKQLQSGDFRLAVARSLPVFRAETAQLIVREISWENAVFSVTTSLGSAVPSILSPFFGLTEAASDIVVLTGNQVRMLFMLGAIHGARVGYIPQWKEVTSIIGAAFGWRSLARELVSKIPFGGGILPKGTVAYAGTSAVGQGIIFFYTTGRRMTRDEISQAFKRTYSEAAEVVRSIAGKLRPPSAGAGGTGEG